MKAKTDRIKGRTARFADIDRAAGMRFRSAADRRGAFDFASSTASRGTKWLADAYRRESSAVDLRPSAYGSERKSFVHGTDGIAAEEFSRGSPHGSLLSSVQKVIPSVRPSRSIRSAVPARSIQPARPYDTACEVAWTRRSGYRLSLRHVVPFVRIVLNLGAETIRTIGTRNGFGNSERTLSTLVKDELHVRFDH